MTYRAWDQTTGHAGGRADASGVGGASAFGVSEETATLTVNPVNDAPTFNLPASPNQTALEDSGLHTVSPFATGFNPGPPNESSQTLLGYQVTNTNNALFSVQPAVDTSGTLTYTLAANANGTATVTVRAQDDGGTANGGVDTSAPRTATIRVTSVNDPPTASNDLAEVEAGSPAMSIAVPKVRIGMLLRAASRARSSRSPELINRCDIPSIIMPGPTQLTRTPKRPSSAAIARTRASTAPFGPAERPSRRG